MKPALVFDLNGTLLDLKALDPSFEMLFGEARAHAKIRPEKGA
jgi:hypothetical protein